MQGYYGDLLGPPSSRGPAARKLLRFYIDLFDLARREPKGATVVEAGSGFGLGLAAIAALGATSKGVEFVPWMADFAARWQAALPPGLGSRIDDERGDANDLPYDDGSTDVVLSLEAISHYLTYDRFLDEAHRVLRPGGVLIISDCNNALNPRIRRHTHSLWASHEVDPRPELARGERIEDHPWWLVERRKEIVLETEPGLEEDEAYRIALGTTGMVRSDVAEATRRYVADGTVPTATYQPGTLTVHPGHEMVLERLFDPFALAREIESHGFAVRSAVTGEARRNGHSSAPRTSCSPCSRLASRCRLRVRFASSQSVASRRNSRRNKNGASVFHSASKCRRFSNSG